MAEDLLGVIQSIIQENMKGMKLADITYGTVESVSPMKIQIVDTMQYIPAAALELTYGVVAKTVPVNGGSGGTVTVNEGLAVGDKVSMLRVSNGQRYIVLSKA